MNKNILVYFLSIYYIFERKWEIYENYKNEIKELHICICNYE